MFLDRNLDGEVMGTKYTDSKGYGGQEVCVFVNHFYFVQFFPVPKFTVEDVISSKLITIVQMSYLFVRLCS
jgi:hypothetical protein